ncbi:MAG: hypothetical protein AMS17_19035 [Spirochaetes bacterium DG_61]|nr:MAG: hypothetical protein AMS17_19035 [Spirochaetes bacterium DG_61]
MQAAIKILKKVDQYNEHRRKSGYKTIGIGIGIHTGSLMLRTVGEQERRITEEVLRQLHSGERADSEAPREQGRLQSPLRGHGKGQREKRAGLDL